LSIEEFEKEYDSPYQTKKYHYNYRHELELADDNLKKTYINMKSKAHFDNADKTVRVENLNIDALNGKEREEMIFKMKKDLEEVGSLADTKDEYFVSLTNPNPMHTQFKLWRKNMFIPMMDQLNEHAERKLEQIEQKKLEDANKDMAFFKATGSESELYEIEGKRKDNERKQAALRAAIAEEQGIKLDDDELDKIRDVVDGKEDPCEEIVEKLPQKKPKQKWRIF